MTSKALHRIEIKGPDKAALKIVWDKMRAGTQLAGAEIFIGRSMAEHPLWFPLFETIGILDDNDEQEDGTNPFLHLTFHIMLGAQIYQAQPPEAQYFYERRLKRGEDSHQILHKMIFLFQRQLAITAKKGESMDDFDWTGYRKLLKALTLVSEEKFWSQFERSEAPHFHPFSPE